MRPYFACVGVRKAFAGRVVLPGVDLSLRQGWQHRLEKMPAPSKMSTSRS